MKLSLRSNPWLWPRDGIAVSRALRVLLFSTNSSSSAAPGDTLSSRIWRSGNPHLSIIPVLEQWLEEGKQIKPSQLLLYMKQLRKYHRYRHALQISEWMNEQNGKNYVQPPAHIAVHVDLVSKVHGIEKAEIFFNSIPDRSRNFKVYGAILNCYAHCKLLEKAEAIMEKMRELGFLKNPLPYNVMLSLYSQMGKYEKLDVLMKDMQKDGIECDIVTFNTLLNAYAAVSKIEEMEKLVMKMEVDPLITIDWHSYIISANGFLKVGQVDKAITMLQRSEQLIKASSRKQAYEILITLYAAVGNKDDVYRVWNLYKQFGLFFNTGYLCMINSLIKLDDIGGMERIWEEWVSGNTLFDVRIPNVILTAYCRKSLWEKVEAYVVKLQESGMELESSSWNRLAIGYYNGGQMEKAVEAMKKAVSVSKRRWTPNVYILAACLEYMKGQGDIKAAEELLKKVGDRCNITEDFRDRLKDAVENASQSTIASSSDGR